MRKKQLLRIGVGGPVGSGKTALLSQLCLALRDKYSMAVVTNDIYTYEDAQFLTRNDALSSDRIMGVETGGCPHTAIREDASMNLAAIDELHQRPPDLDFVLLESGGDNLSATKIDVAELVGASLEVMDTDSKRMRGDRPFVFSNMKTQQGLAEIIEFIETEGMLK